MSLNPCLDYVDYLAAHHPEKFGPEGESQWRLTYQHKPDADVGLECLAMLQELKAADRREAKALAEGRPSPTNLAYATTTGRAIQQSQSRRGGSRRA